MNVLVIDDARVMRNIIMNAIKENYKGDTEFYEAADGIEGLQVMKEKNINLICIDWNMPKLNGLEFVKKIRSMEYFKETPIIMITSESAKYMILDAVKAGVTDYVIKPAVGRKLWDKLAPHFKKVAGV